LQLFYPFYFSFFYIFPHSSFFFHIARFFLVPLFIFPANAMGLTPPPGACFFPDIHPANLAQHCIFAVVCCELNNVKLYGTGTDTGTGKKKMVPFCQLPELAQLPLSIKKSVVC
jgi:hypothetical protein